MSQAKPITVRSSSTGIYAQIKNGNVYRLLTPITEERKEGACREIQEAGVMRLKHWVLVRTKSEQRAIDDLAWEEEWDMSEEELMNGCNWMHDALKAQEADNGVAS
jgi:hypothetical protein